MSYDDGSECGDRHGHAAFADTNTEEAMIHDSSTQLVSGSSLKQHSQTIEPFQVKCINTQPDTSSMASMKRKRISNQKAQRIRERIKQKREQLMFSRKVALIEKHLHDP